MKQLCYLLMLGLVTCSTPKIDETEVTAKQPVRETKEIPSYQTQVRYAKGFSITYKNTYKTVTIRTLAEEGTEQKYALISRGQKPPKDFDQQHIIEVPVRSIVPLSSTFVEPMNLLGVSHQITGVQKAEYITHKKLLQRIKEEKVAEVGKSGTLNDELLIAMHPDVIMVSGVAGENSTRYGALQQAGIMVLPNFDWQETTPLGRAEWIKFIGLLFKKEKEAEKRFKKIEAAYKKIQKIARKAKKHPQILVGIPYKDTWYVSGGDSYIAKIFQDAGAEYPWKEEKVTGSVPLDIEAVYPVGLQAPYWINVGTLQEKEALLAADARFSTFKSVKKNQVYNHTKEYWNEGVMHPDLILADLVKILHPGLLPDYSFTYYHKIQ